MKYRARVDHYDHFFRPSHAYKGSWFFKTIAEAKQFIHDREEAKIKWPDTFANSEYKLVILIEG